MFVVMKVQDFEFESKGWKPPYPITFDMGKMVGYLPVYEKREDAEKDFPGAPIVEVRLTDWFPKSVKVVIA